MKKKWTVYMLQCADGTIYTGITNNFEERLGRHHNGTGAKYTRGRGPFKVLFAEAHISKSSALRREIAIKRLDRARKLTLARGLKTA